LARQQIPCHWHLDYVPAEFVSVEGARFRKSQFASEDHMKRLSVVGGICASLLLGVTVTAVAQDEHKNERQEPAPAQNQKDQARPEDRQRQEPQSGDRREMTPQNEGRQEQQPQSGDRHPERQQDERQMQQPERRQNMGEQQEREKDRHKQARPQGQMQGDEHAQAGGRVENRRRISDSDFRAHFGREHRFAPGRMQVYEGHPEFNYGGYVFEIVEVWPADWAYDEDDYYIDYVDDEYWLYSFDHPGVRLELIIIG
jgi:hypothetical protein